MNGKVAFKNPSKIYPFWIVVRPFPDIDVEADPNK